MNSEQRMVTSNVVSSFVVADIKTIITRLNDRLHTRIARTGRKQQLVDSIINVVSASIQIGNVETPQTFVDILNEVQGRQCYEWDGMIRRKFVGHTSHQQRTAQPRTVPIPATTRLNLTYKSSPFYTIESRLTEARILAASVNTRNMERFTFQVTPDQLAFFSQQNAEDGRPRYQIRLFCASFDASNTTECEVEFPAICELKVNMSHVITGNSLRGMKNRPGTAHPADVTSGCHLHRTNHVDFVYANTSRPYIGTVELVRRKAVVELVEELKSTKKISKEETLQRLQERMEDADVVLESETISTKCPLGFTRIQTPTRSKNCCHLQCFDAANFLQMNEQTATWSCPICNRRMTSWEELGTDEYFQNILNQVSDNVESIRIEGGGRMKVLDSSSDDDYDDSETESNNDHANNIKNALEKNGSNDAITASVTISDDDDDSDKEDDTPLAKRQKTQINAIPLSLESASASAPTITSEQPRSYSQGSNDTRQVIDLTLDSEDEDVDHGDAVDYEDEGEVNNIIQNDTGMTAKDENEENQGSQEAPMSSSTSPYLSASVNGMLSTTSTAPTTLSPMSPTNTTIHSMSSPPADIMKQVTTAGTLVTTPTSDPPRNLIRLPWPSPLNKHSLPAISQAEGSSNFPASSSSYSSSMSSTAAPTASPTDTNYNLPEPSPRFDQNNNNLLPSPHTLNFPNLYLDRSPNNVALVPLSSLSSSSTIASPTLGSPTSSFNNPLFEN